MTRAIVYARVSTDAQEREGTSLDTQERACVEHAEAQGWTVLRCVRDSFSGATLDRPGMRELRELVRHREVDVVVAYAIDRLARDQVKLAVLVDEVNEAGATLAIVSEPFETSATGMLITNVRAFAAALEREKTAERTMRGKGERARSGRIPQATGKGIYGYSYDRDSGKRVVVEDQAAIVRRVFEEFVERRSCNAISNRLNAEGIPAFGGGRWYARTIARLLENETFTGRTVYRRTRATRVFDAKAGKKVRRVIQRDHSEHIVVPDATPAIIPVELFERARAILADPARRARLDRASVFALRGRIVCAECGAAMVGHALTTGERRYRYYRCSVGSSGPGETRCSSRYVRADDLEVEVRERLAALLSHPRRVVAEVKRASTSTAKASRAASLRRQLADVDRQRSRLADLYLNGGFDQATLDARARALDERARTIEAQLREVSDASGVRVAAALRSLPEATEAIARWVRVAEGDDLDLLLRAVDVTVRASTENVTITGSIPLVEIDDGALWKETLALTRATFAVPEIKGSCADRLHASVREGHLG